MIKNEKTPVKIGQIRILSENPYFIVDEPTLGLFMIYSFKRKHFYLWEKLLVEKDFILVDL